MKRTVVGLPYSPSSRRYVQARFSGQNGRCSDGTALALKQQRSIHVAFEDIMKNVSLVAGKLVVPAILLAFALPAQAVEISYEGSTSGSFSDPTTANYLSFTGVDFGPGVTSGGSAMLMDLGTFTVILPGSNPAIAATGSFNLNITFTVPSGANPANPIVAAVAGTINKSNANNVVLDFGSGQTINFASPDGSGSFFFVVNDVSFPNGSGSWAQQTLTGSISNAVFNLAPDSPLLPNTVPEPGSLALLGLGLAGLGLGRRRNAN